MSSIFRSVSYIEKKGRWNMSQIKSKERVAERGEVFTAEREVNAMCDLVANECLRPDSRFLEPACGDGNFLSAILKRKLAELRRKYKKSPRDYEKQAIIAIGSLYGVDIMNDNVIACRERLYKIWNEEYTDHCKSETSDEAREAAKFIISRMRRSRFRLDNRLLRRKYNQALF